MTARGLRTSARRAWILAAAGVLLVFGLVAAAPVDPDRFAPAVTADQSPWSVAAANIALTAGVVALLVAVIGLARVRHQRRTVLRSTRPGPRDRAARRLLARVDAHSHASATVVRDARARDRRCRCRPGVRLRGRARARFDEAAVGQAEGHRERARTVGTAVTTHHAAGRRSHRDRRPRQRDLVP